MSVRLLSRPLCRAQFVAQDIQPGFERVVVERRGVSEEDSIAAIRAAVGGRWLIVASTVTGWFTATAPTGSEIILADDSAYAEHAASGFVYTGETVNALDRLFDTLRAECHKASESLALLERMTEAWATTGARAAIPGPTAGAA